MNKFLQLEDLIDGHVYQVQARNFSIAVFYDTQFWGIRYKWGEHFLDTEDPYDEPYHGTVLAEKDIGVCPLPAKEYTINSDTLYNFLDEFKKNYDTAMAIATMEDNVEVKND